jgi:glycosyltransferase involved in cell wall biosynthesis
MKIAYLEPAGKGGMIHYAFQLCRALSELGADVTLITDKTYELEALPHSFSVECILELWDAKPAGKLSMKPWAIAWRKVRRLGRAIRHYQQWLVQIRRVAELKPDVVLIGDIRFPFDLFPLLLLRGRSRTLVDICHNVRPFATGGGLFDRSRWREIFYRHIYRLFDRVFVHFERNRREFEQTFGVPSNRVSVIVHGNEAIFRDLRATDAGALRKRIGLPAGRRVVLFFGTLSRYKGIDVLLPAFAEVLVHTNAQLVLAGFPSPDFDIREHQELARRLGIEDAVTWVTEYVDSRDVAAWMELASVMVFPYRDIYQSGALHVAQTFGVPTVATAIGAMTDVIEDSVSGLIVPPENVDELASAIVRLLTNDALAGRLGARAKADANGPFSWTTIANTILNAVRKTEPASAPHAERARSAG